MTIESERNTKERKDSTSPTYVQLGQLVITAVAEATLNKEDVHRSLRRHLVGDWGDVCKDDKAANDLALKQGDRLLSAYSDRAGTKFWIITEHDRSVTTVLLPSDY